MKYICFKNTGTIEPDFIRSFGVSVKNDASCIGFFGTGLKYALAILMREGAKVTIYSGGEVMRFAKKSVILKGKSFEFVTMNGEQLPFTTELGKTWEPWMAYRELYSNAKDEGGEVDVIESLPSNSDSMTYIVVAGGGIEQIHAAKDSIFCASIGDLADEIYTQGGSFYSKGVCVWKFEGMPSLYSYNDASGYCDLTEDRQIKYTHQVHKIVSEQIARLTDKQALEAIVTAERGLYESCCDFDYCGVKPSAEFLEVALMHKDSCENQYLIRYAEKHAPRMPLQEFELDDYQRELFDNALFSVKMAGFMVDEYPIKFVLNLDNGALGQAKSGTIYISRECFLVGGLEMLKATLIEEWVHLKFKYNDCERPMQNYLFTQIVRLVDQCNAITKQKYAA